MWMVVRWAAPHKYEWCNAYDNYEAANREACSRARNGFICYVLKVTHEYKPSVEVKEAE